MQRPKTEFRFCLHYAPFLVRDTRDDRRRNKRRMRRGGKRPWHQERAFLNLRKEWYAKLKEDGFEDVELIDWRTGEAFERTMGVSQADIVNTWSLEQQEYYRIAAQYVLTLKRRRGKNRENAEAIEVWRLHSEGKSYRKIAKELKVPISRIEKIVPRIKTKMLQEREDNFDEAEMAAEWLEGQ